MEAAQLGVISLHGPHVYNSSAKYDKFKSEGISYEISNAQDIVERFGSLSATVLEVKAQTAKNISRVDMLAVEESSKAIRKALGI